LPALLAYSGVQLRAHPLSLYRNPPSQKLFWRCWGRPEPVPNDAYHYVFCVYLFLPPKIGGRQSRRQIFRRERHCRQETDSEEATTAPMRVTIRKESRPTFKELGKVYPFFDLVQMNLYAMWPPPVFFWLPQHFIIDLLFGRVSLWTTGLYKLFERARSEGLEMRWIQRKELGDFQGLSGTIPGSPSAVGIGVKIADDPMIRRAECFWSLCL